MQPTLCLIVAAAANGVIGRNGRMPWHLRAELRYFRQRTLGKPVIMGRKTFQSIGKPLPGRHNIVITRDAAFNAPGAEIVSSLDAAIAAALVAAATSNASEIMVIGGADIFRQALPLAARVYLTRVDAHPTGDAVFPDLPEQQWRLIEQHPLPADAANKVSATAGVYERLA